MKFSIYFIFSFLLFANIHLHAKHKPNIIGLKQEGTSSSLYSPKNTNGISYDTAILVKWPLNKNGQFNVAGIVIGKLVNNKFVANRTRIKVESINIPQKLGDILIDGAPILFEKMVGGVNQGVGVPMDTAILIKWPPVKSGNKFTTVSSMVTGYIQDGDFLFAQQGNRLISTTVGKYGDILIDDVPIPPYDTPNGRVTNGGISSTNPGQVERRAGGGEPEKPKGCYCVEEPTPGTFTGVNVDCPGGDCVKCCADVKKQGGTRVPVPAEVALAISKGQYTGDWGDKKYYFNEVKSETTTLSQISTNWDKTKYPYGIVVLKDSQFIYDDAENIQELMKSGVRFNKNKAHSLKSGLGKLNGRLAARIIPTTPGDNFLNTQVANGVSTRPASGNASTKSGVIKTKILKGQLYKFDTKLGYIVLTTPPDNSPSSPETGYDANTRLVKCTDADGNDYYVNCPEGTENCCGLAPLPQIDLTTPAENNGNPDGGTKPKPETTTLSQISTNWDKTKYPYGIVVFNNSKYGYDKAENIQEWMKDNKNLKGKGEMPVPVFIIPITPKDTTIQAANGAGTRIATSQASAKPGLKRTVVVAPPNNTPFFPEIVYRENTRLVKCTDADGNDYYVNCPEGTENCCGLAPLPQIDLSTPAENNGNPNGGTKPKPETTTLSQISTNWDKTKYPYGIVVFNNSKYGYDKAENIQEWMKDNKNLKGKGEMPVPVFIIPIKPKDTTIQAANGAGTRIATGQASNKPGLKRTVVVAPPNNTPFFPEIVYRENTRLVKCTDADGNDYYVNCPEGTENCCGLALLPQIDLTSPAENNGNPDGGTKPKPETTTLSQISTNWDKTKYPYGIVVLKDSQFVYDDAENIQELMRPRGRFHKNKANNLKSGLHVFVNQLRYIIPTTPGDNFLNTQVANGVSTRPASGNASTKSGVIKTKILKGELYKFDTKLGYIVPTTPPDNSPSSPEIGYDANTRLVKCTDTDGNDYYVNCPEGTENCCGLTPLPQIDLTTPTDNNGNPDGGTKPKPETTTLSGILANWDKTKNPYGIVVFKNSQFVYDKAENIQEWMKGFKKLKGKKEKGYEAYYIIPTTPKDTTIQAANGAGTRIATGQASNKPGLKRIEIVSPPNNSPSSPEIIYDANTRLVKCTDKDGNDYYVNCPEGTGNCCELAPLPFIDLTSPEKQESFGSGNNHPDSTMSFKWPEDFNKSAYKDLKFEPNAILIGKDGKKRNVKFNIHPNYRFVVFKDISTDYIMTTMPAGTLFLTPFNGTYAGFNKPSIFVTMPQGSVKANGAGTRLATSQASAKPGLKRLTPPPAPIGATVPQGEILFKYNGGGIKIDTAIVIYWPPVNGKDDYRQTAPPEGSTIFYPEASIAAIQKAPSGTILHYTQTNMTNLGSNKDDVFTTVYKYGDILIDDVPIPFEWRQSPSKIPSTDTAIIVKWPEDFKKAAYKEASFEAMATFVAANGKFYFIDLDSDGDGFFDVDELASKIPAGTMLLKRGATRKNTEPFIFVTMPQGSVKANGAGTRLATSQASTKPGLKRLTPPPAPIGATVPLGEVLFKNNGGGIKIDTAIVIYWPPVTGKDDYRQIPPPNNNMVVFSAGIVNDFKPFAENPEDRHGRLVLSRRKAKLMLAWQGLVAAKSNNDNDEYNVAESINDAKNMDKSNLGVLIDTIQVIKWPEDFKKAAYQEASFEAMATFVAADGKFYFIDLDSDGDGFFDIDELASKIPAGTMLLKKGAKSKTANNSNFHTVSFTKNGDTLPTYTMQIALPNGSSMDKLFEMSDQAQNYKMREIISLHIGQAGKQTTSNEKDIPIALPYFDTNGNLLFWATNDAITLTYEKNAVNNSSIAKNNKYDMDIFKSFYKTLINDNPTFAYPQFKKDRLRAVPHTELSIEGKREQKKIKK